MFRKDVEAALGLGYAGVSPTGFRMRAACRSVAGPGTLGA